jgi:hypothetical protein
VGLCGTIIAPVRGRASIGDDVLNEDSIDRYAAGLERAHPDAKKRKAKEFATRGFLFIFCEWLCLTNKDTLVALQQLYEKVAVRASRTLDRHALIHTVQALSPTRSPTELFRQPGPPRSSGRRRSLTSGNSSSSSTAPSRTGTSSSSSTAPSRTQSCGCRRSPFRHYSTDSHSIMCVQLIINTGK